VAAFTAGLLGAWGMPMQYPKVPAWAVHGAPSRPVETQCWAMLGVSRIMLGVHVHDYVVIIASITH